MKIAICGAGHGNYDEDVMNMSYDLGSYLAEKNVSIVTGAGYGYPYQAVKGAAGKTTILGISPAKDQDEHTSRYKYPLKHFDEITFTGLGAPGRNLTLVKEAHAIIVIGGQSGTLSELGLALNLKKPVGILKDSGGISTLAKDIAKYCDREQSVVLEKDPRKIVDKLIGITVT